MLTITIEQREIVENRNHVEMIQHPELWPHRPFLPLRRDKASETLGYEVGFIWESPEPSDGSVTVLLCNLWMITDLPEDWVVPVLHYASAQAVVDAGWIVD